MFVNFPIEVPVFLVGVAGAMLNKVLVIRGIDTPPRVLALWLVTIGILIFAVWVVYGMSAAKACRPIHLFSRGNRPSWVLLRRRTRL